MSLSPLWVHRTPLHAGSCPGAPGLLVTQDWAALHLGLSVIQGDLHSYLERGLQPCQEPPTRLFPARAGRREDMEAGGGVAYQVQEQFIHPTLGLGKTAARSPWV